MAETKKPTESLENSNVTEVSITDIHDAPQQNQIQIEKLVNAYNKLVSDYNT